MDSGWAQMLIQLGALVGALWTLWHYMIQPLGQQIIRLTDAVQRIEAANPAWVDERESVLARLDRLEQQEPT